jgi:localization factor PodJL
MAFPEQSKPQQDRAGAKSSDALADLRERLGQFARQIEQLREGLPDEQAHVLARVERGIAHLAKRVAVIGQNREEPHFAAPIVEDDPDSPWDAQSAEALMRVYETAEAEYASSQRARPAMSEAPRSTAAITNDHARIDAQLSDMSAMLQLALADMDPRLPLAALERRLDQFEQRLDAALKEMASPAGSDRLARIEGHVGELARHVEAACGQLERLNAMDGELRDLKQTMSEHEQQPAPAQLTEQEIATLIDTAAERAVSQFAEARPAPLSDGHEARIGALEVRLLDYIADRHRRDEIAGNVLYTIEDAVTRLAGSLEAAGSTNPASQSASAEPVGDGDGIDLESARLAEAYAAGARALGREPPAQTLDAADYDPRPAFPPAAGYASKAASPPPLPPMPDASATLVRQELRASVMRAKVKAQAPPGEPSAPTESLDAAKASMLTDRRLQNPERSNHRRGLLLATAMALMCATGFLLVDNLVSGQPPPGMHQNAMTPPAEPTPAASTPAKLGPLPSGTPAKGPSSNVDEPAAAVAPAGRPPPPSRVLPETVTDGLNADQRTPTPALGPLRTGSTTPPAVIETAALPRGGAGTLPPLPATLGTAGLRTAAAAGDAAAEFEVATHYAEGNGAPRDHALAFGWLARAAHAGLAPAQFRLGAYLEHGVGVESDLEQARFWYRRAAEQGYARAMHNLAVLSAGRGAVQPDYASAAMWFRKAAERGVTDSQFNLAVLYDHGRGVPRDVLAAYKWYALAARSGDPMAARHLDRLKGTLDASRVKAIEEKIAVWQPIASGTDDKAPKVGR